MAPSEAGARMRPFEFELLRRTYERMADICRAQGIIPYYIYLTNPNDPRTPETVAALTSVASEAGLHVIDLSNVYDGHDGAMLQVAPWDRHPNARAHRLIADRLYAEFSKPHRLARPLNPDPPPR